MKGPFVFLVAACAAAALATPTIHSDDSGVARRSGATLMPVQQRPLKMAVSRPLRELARSSGRSAQVPRVDDGAEARELPMFPLARTGEAAAPLGAARPQAADPVAQRWAPELLAPAPSVVFDGINNLDNANAFGFRVLPPDTNGDVGPNHYVQFVNLLFRVYSKTGTPLIPPTKLSSVFSPLGAPCGAEDDGDPIVLYDHLANRWLLSQFALPSFPSPPFHQCIAISQTADPTGAYFLYDFLMPNAKLNDYPHLGLWPDAYYMTDNQFAGPSLSFAGAGVFAFERAKMLVGDPTASFIYFDLAAFDPGLGGMLASDLDGPPPAPGTPNTFAAFTADEFGDPFDGLRLFDFHADFGIPANSTFTERAESPLPVAAFDPTFNSASGACAGSATGFTSRDDLDQPPIPAAPAASCNAKLDAIADRLLHRLQYRNFADHESLTVTHTVDVNFVPNSTPGYQAGVRYYELRRSGGGAFAVNEQGSFAPDTDHRWMGSAALDSNGNLAVGFSVTSASTFPSVRYAGRLTSDPPGGLFQGEGTLKAGAGSQGNTASRWGDYSGLTVDPADNCTFWYTTEYYNATNALGQIACSSTGFLSTACWSTAIGSFRFPTCISNASASKTVLWPPNHKFVPVTINYGAGASASCSLSVSSNEPVDGTGDGDTSPDWIVVDSHHVQLRAERAGGGTGRIYTITITCSDAGGFNTQSVIVTVPHDRGR